MKTRIESLGLFEISRAIWGATGSGQYSVAASGWPDMNPMAVGLKPDQRNDSSRLLSLFGEKMAPAVIGMGYIPRLNITDWKEL